MIFEDKYKVLWKNLGYSYAQPVVYTKEKLFGLFDYWKYRGEFAFSKPRDEALTLSDKELTRWFTGALNEYKNTASAAADFEQRVAASNSKNHRLRF